MDNTHDIQPTIDEAKGDQSVTEPPDTSRRTRVLRRVVVTMVALLALFYAAGGWYFSTVLGDDAFVVDDHVEDPTDDFDVEVVSARADRITFRAEEGSDPDLLATGTFGVEMPHGWMQVGDVIEARVENGFDIVTRSLESTDGQLPSAGTRVDFDAWFYEANPSDVGLDYEDVTYRSLLGEFDAWFVPGNDDTWAIVIHGKGAERREGLRVLESLNAAGHPALAITYRNDPGQPGDPSDYYRYGSTEWVEVEGAVRYAIEHGAEDVVMVGLSTGAANALSFSYESDLAGHVAGAIFDSPNIDFGRTVDYGASQRSLPLIGTKVPQSLTTVAKFIGSLRFDFDWSQHDFIDDIDEIVFPILVFHGTDDGTVPLDVSERLHSERPDLVTLVVVDGAEHVQSWNDDPSTYDTNVRAFLEAVG